MPFDKRQVAKALVSPSLCENIYSDIACVYLVHICVKYILHIQYIFTSIFCDEVEINHTLYETMTLSKLDCHKTGF